MLTSSKRHTIHDTDQSVVQIDYTDIREAALSDSKASLALAIYERSGRHTRDAMAFLKRARWVFAPDPAHLVDTSPDDVGNFIMMDQEPNPFVMDGERIQGQRLSEASSPLAKAVAIHTYGQVKRLDCPAFYTVAMPERVYHRIMFPFGEAGNVTRIITLVHPILHRKRLHEILH
jgi:hypothetical protein